MSLCDVDDDPLDPCAGVLELTSGTMILQLQWKTRNNNTIKTIEFRHLKPIYIMIVGITIMHALALKILPWKCILVLKVIFCQTNNSLPIARMMYGKLLNLSLTKI